MLPLTHIILGGIFVILFNYLGHISLFETIILFLSAFIFDIDHYIFYIFYKKDLNLFHAYKYLRHDKKDKPMMMIFHTIEFLFFVGVLSYFWRPFIFVFLGLIFHSLLDIVQMTFDKELHLREFSFIRYLIIKNKFPKYYQ